MNGFRLDRLQPLGRALMLPIAVLPVAGLLLRLGQPDLLDIAVLSAAGEAIFSNLGLLFAVGVAVGFARENHGAAALAGAVCYLVVVEGAKALLTVPPDVTAAFADQAARDLATASWKAKQLAKLSVPAGLLSGITAGLLYNRYSNIKLPEYLAFFAGRRFVPIIAGVAGLFGAVLFGLGFPYLEQAIDQLSRWVVQAGGVGLFLYGFLNRLLIVTGLHHILNNIAWFIIGDFNGATGDLKRFFAGDKTAGAFMAGFFPIMMFGLPAAGLFDYLLNYGIATKPLMLVPVGAAYFAIYYFSFRWCIVRFNLKTPGREVEAIAAAPASSGSARGADFLAALGGPANVRSVDACMTRLRLTMADPAAVDEPRLKALGARGMVRPGGDALQVVLGPIADQVAGEIRDSMREGAA